MASTSPASRARSSCARRAARPSPCPAALVCALAAELVLPMKTLPSEIFAETDLLDFPGARNRFEQPLSQDAGRSRRLCHPAPLARQGRLSLRPLCRERGDHLDVLCVPDSNMETVDLPGLVENWIGMTTAAAGRRAETCVLFFVMTKFDKHLGDSAAAGSKARGSSAGYRPHPRSSVTQQGRLGRDTDAGSAVPQLLLAAQPELLRRRADRL